MISVFPGAVKRFVSPWGDACVPSKEAFFSPLPRPRSAGSSFALPMDGRHSALRTRTAPVENTGLTEGNALPNRHCNRHGLLIYFSGGAFQWTKRAPSGEKMKKINMKLL